MSVFFRLEIYDAKLLYIKCDEIDRHEIDRCQALSVHARV